MKNKFFLICITGFMLLSSFQLVAQTTFVVNTMWDDLSPGTLRHAITQANLNTSSIIRFNIPDYGSDPLEIVLDSTLGALPVITKPLTIDGTSQPGYATGSPRINIKGSIPTPTFATGIVFDQVSGCKLLGIGVYGFSTGVTVKFSNNCEILDCMINKCYDVSLSIYSSTYCTVKGNMINTNKTGTDLFPTGTNYNCTTGIELSNDGTKANAYHIIGGQNCSEANIIAYTKNSGIDHGGTLSLNSNTVFSGNKIYGISTSSIAINLRSASNANIQPPAISGTSGCTVTGTTTIPYGIIEVFSGASGVSDKKTASGFLVSTVANVSGAWSVSTGISPTNRVTATVRDPLTGNTSELVNAVAITASIVFIERLDGTRCIGAQLPFTTKGTNICSSRNMWDYGDGLTESGVHIFSEQGTYDMNVYVLSQSGCASVSNDTTVIITSSPCSPVSCTSCIPSFSPLPGDYLITAWTKVETPVLTDITYTTPKIEVSFPSGVNPSYNFSPAGEIIDGWQRIEGKFTLLPGETQIMIKLKCLSGTGNCLFDDIRVFPLDGSMKTYVYDATSLKLMAELDERNYSTFYEYDEEGKLIRVKKETEKGIMTIKENRESSNKR